jgi:hypothetical protein
MRAGLMSQDFVFWLAIIAAGINLAILYAVIKGAVSAALRAVLRADLLLPPQHPPSGGDGSRPWEKNR